MILFSAIGYYASRVAALKNVKRGKIRGRFFDPFRGAERTSWSRHEVWNYGSTDLRRYGKTGCFF